MTVDFEPAPRPTPLWAVPAVIAVLALALLIFVQRYADDEVTGFGGQAQPPTPMPSQLADGSPPPEVPGPLSELFGDDVVMTERLEELPDGVDRPCREPYRDAQGPALSRLQAVIDESDMVATHLGPDGLTTLSVNVDDVPPGYPNEIEIACVAGMVDGEWTTQGRPYLDYALDGRPGAALEEPLIRSRLVQVPVGARWAMTPRGGWWLGYDVRGSSWTLMTLPDAVTERQPLRVTFVDDTGAVVAERGVGPTRAAADSDHSADYELVAGNVRPVLERLAERPIRVCEPGDDTVCVWLTLDDRQEIQAFAAFGPHPLDTPPMGYVGYCPEAELFQGSVTSARFRTDGSWAGGPSDRGLDRYDVRFEAGKVVVDLSSHVTGDQPRFDEITDRPSCVFDGQPRGTAQ